MAIRPETTKGINRYEYILIVRNKRTRSKKVPLYGSLNCIQTMLLLISSSKVSYLSFFNVSKVILLLDIDKIVFIFVGNNNTTYDN